MTLPPCIDITDSMIMTGAQLKTWRKTLRKTQSQLADLIGSSTDTILRNEKRERLTSDLILKIMEFKSKKRKG